MPIQKYWKDSEDKFLLEMIKKHGVDSNWSKIAKELQKRKIRKSSKQCKRRYHNHLSEDINNTKLTPKEQKKIFALFKQHGNKWKLISSFFKNRTDSIIKNTFFSMIRKCIRQMNKVTNWEVNNKIINKSVPSCISRFLEMTSDSHFTPLFQVVDVVEHFIKHQESLIDEELTDEQIEKVRHSVMLFKNMKSERVRESDDDVSRVRRKKIRKMSSDDSFASPPSSFKIRLVFRKGEYNLGENKENMLNNDQNDSKESILITKNECIKNGKKLNKGDVRNFRREIEKDKILKVIAEVRTLYYLLKSYSLKTSAVLENCGFKLLDKFIEFVRNNQSGLFEIDLLRDGKVFMALKRIMVSYSSIVISITENMIDGFDVRSFILNPLIDDVSCLYITLVDLLADLPNRISLKEEQCIRGLSEEGGDRGDSQSKVVCKETDAVRELNQRRLE